MEFRSGPSYPDIMKWYIRMGVISIGVFFIFFSFVVVMISLEEGSIEGLFSGIFILVIIFIPFMILYVPLMLLSGLVVRYLHFSGNRVKLGSTGIHTMTIRNRFYPAVRNTIPYRMIERIEEGNEGYIHHIRKKTPKWYYALTMMHRIPHAGLYIPMTSPRNLLVIYMKNPVDITNNNMRNPLFLGLKIENHPVKEVIIDVEFRRHEEFLNRIMEISGRNVCIK